MGNSLAKKSGAPVGSTITNTNKAPTPESKGSESVKPVERPYEPGEGIRSLKTSSVFRTLNFELYAKPNKTIMVIGVAGFTLCLGYLTYLNYHYDHSEYYEALDEDGTKILRPKKSRWDS